MGNHHVQWVNPRTKWPFSIAMLVYRRVFVIVPTVIIDGFHHLNDCSFKCYLFAVCQCEPSLASHVPDGFPRYNLRAFKLGMIGVKSIIPILHSVTWSSSQPFYIYIYICDYICILNIHIEIPHHFGKRWVPESGHKSSDAFHPAQLLPASLGCIFINVPRNL